jgi:hypothetical protein
MPSRNWRSGDDRAVFSKRMSEVGVTIIAARAMEAIA